MDQVPQPAPYPAPPRCPRPSPTLIAERDADVCVRDALVKNNTMADSYTVSPVAVGVALSPHRHALYAWVPPSPRVRCRKAFVTYLLTGRCALAREARPPPGTRAPRHGPEATRLKKKKPGKVLSRLYRTKDHLPKRGARGLNHKSRLPLSTYWSREDVSCGERCPFISRPSSPTRPSRQQLQGRIRAAAAGSESGRCPP